MIEVRRVRPDEYVEAGAVTASAWQPLGAPEDADWKVFQARNADVAGRDAIAQVFVAIDNGQILGSVTLEFTERIPETGNPLPLDPDEAHVRVLAVRPSARRRGIGGLLMKHCLEVSRKAGKARLTLNTSSGNEIAQRFYESIGFVRRPDVSAPDGSALVAFEIVLDAPQP